MFGCVVLFAVLVSGIYETNVNLYENRRLLRHPKIAHEDALIVMVEYRWWTSAVPIFVESISTLKLLLSIR